ncbi:hypothetical protein AAFF_G00393060 [Aldrovandia affinis]|uniref:Uncharacterized protein n=1 Tax=Aldrovandia affinis TaxID=143900 RepID=A0AAD7SDX3_9TELE|nr:hypothetical protein AAFF_G00393060 [Aldrovandia affinis]
MDHLFYIMWAPATFHRAIHGKGKANGAEQALQASNLESRIARTVARELSPTFHQPGPEYIKKRVLQDIAESNENEDVPPASAEEVPATRPETPQIHEVENPGQPSAPHTPSPSPAASPPEPAGGGGGNRGGNRPGTPSLAGAAGSRGYYARSAGRQGDRAEQGHDMEIKPLQRIRPEPKTADVPPFSATRTDGEDRPPPKPAATPLPESKPDPERGTEVREPAPEQAAPVAGKQAEPQGEAGDPSTRATPAPEPKPKPAGATPEPTTKAEPIAIAKTAGKAGGRTDTNADARARMTGKTSAEARDLSEEEGPNTVVICMRQPSRAIGDATSRHREGKLDSSSSPREPSAAKMAVS